VPGGEEESFDVDFSTEELAQTLSSQIGGGGDLVAERAESR